MKRSWNTVFKRHGKVFTDPHPQLDSVLEILKETAAERVLDLGCGSGRHTVYLAWAGFAVTGTDRSAEGLKMTRASLKAAGLTADLILHNFTNPFPFEENAFDAVISVQVIHHAKTAEIVRAASEIARVLKPGGILFVTVPSRQNQGTRFRKLEPKTLVPLDGIEKGIPHHYFDEAELRKTFQRFEIREISIDEHEHYCLLARKPESSAIFGESEGAESTE